MGNSCKIIDFSQDKNELDTISFEKKVILKFYK